MFLWYAVAQNDENSDNSRKTFVTKLDINGAKAPNKFGEDVFVFNRVAGKGIMPDGYAAQIIAAGWKIKN